MEESTPPSMGEGVENSQLVVVRDKARPDLMNPVHRALYHDHVMCDVRHVLPDTGCDVNPSAPNGR